MPGELQEAAADKSTDILLHSAHGCFWMGLDPVNRSRSSCRNTHTHTRTGTNTHIYTLYLKPSFDFILFLIFLYSCVPLQADAASCELVEMSVLFLSMKQNTLSDSTLPHRRITDLLNSPLLHMHTHTHKHTSTHTDRLL